MSVYLGGYILVALVVLAGVNGALLRNRRKRKTSRGNTNLRAEKVETSLRTGTVDTSRRAEKVDTNLRTETVDTGLQAEKMDTGLQAETAKANPQTELPEGEINVVRIVTALMLGAFVTILNQTLINVALPQIMSDFNVSANTVQWLITGFMLVNGVLIPITAYLIERFGTRQLFLTAMGFFTAGALIAATAPSFSILMTGRLVQAVGAGIIMPLMMTIFLTVFPPHKRGRAMGAMGIPMMFAPALGPTLSGWIVQNYNWRILFFIVIPIAIFDLILAFFWIRNVTKLSHPKFDLWGVVTSTIGFGSLLYGFSEAGNKGWDSAEVVISLAIGIISLILFVWRELTVEQPMLEFRVFKYDVFTLTTIISSVLNMAMFAAMILLPIYLQNIRGFTPLEAGLLMLPGALITAVMQPIAGIIFDKIGARILAIIGLTITAITTWMFSKLTADTTYSHILALYISRMFGMSFLMMTVMTAGMNQLPRTLNAHGTAMSNTMRQVAASLGTAFLVTVMTNRADFHLANYSNVVNSANPLQMEQMAGVGQAVAAAGGLPAQTGSSVAAQLVYGMAMKQSVIDGINDSFVVATGITLVALFLSFFIKRVKPSHE